MKTKWTTVQYNIAQFYSMLNQLSPKRIDCDPVGQRPDVESLEKKQGIIDTILRGYDFGELKLREIGEGEYYYRSIDGGHRKRAVRDFIENKFKTGRKGIFPNKYYKDLTEEEKQNFLNYNIRFTIYDKSMTTEEAGEVFRRTNISTDVNHQEMLNSYEDNLVAKFVREISRPIRDLNNKYHELFEYRDLSSDNRKQYWFHKTSTRLRDDEYVTRFLVILSKSMKEPNWLTCSTRESEEFFVKFGNKDSGIWATDPAEAKRHQKLVIDALDFMLNYAKAKKTQSKQLLGVQEFVVMTRFYAYLIRTFGKNGFKVKNWNELYRSIRNAMDHFVGKNENILRDDKHKDNKGIRTVHECFRQYLSVHGDQMRAEQSVKWLLEEMNINDCGILFLDRVRVFPPEIVEQVLRSQDYKCWVTGKPLDIGDAVGGHIVAHSQGGRTTIDNCMVCHKDENSNMGAMDALLYRTLRRSEMANEEMIA